MLKRQLQNPRKHRTLTHQYVTLQVTVSARHLTPRCRVSFSFSRRDQRGRSSCLAMQTRGKVFGRERLIVLGGTVVLKKDLISLSRD